MWRPYEPGDEAEVKALHERMEQRLGRGMDLPDLSARPVICAAVHVVDGKIEHCLFLEAMAEACAVGEKPLSARCAQEAVERFLLPAARYYSLRIVRSFVPRQLLEAKRDGRLGAVPRLLKKLGFTQENYSLVQFYRWLVPQKGE